MFESFTEGARRVVFSVGLFGLDWLDAAVNDRDGSREFADVRYLRK